MDEEKTGGWTGVVLSSSNLSSCDYDPESKKLTIRFTGGGEYRYLEVPQEVAQDLIEASSPGKYFFNFIRSRYAYDRIN